MATTVVFGACEGEGGAVRGGGERKRREREEMEAAGRRWRSPDGLLAGEGAPGRGGAWRRGGARPRSGSGGPKAQFQGPAGPRSGWGGWEATWLLRGRPICDPTAPGTPDL